MTASVERLLSLLSEDAPPADASSGYVDLLGAAHQAGPSTGIAQRLMRNNFVARIYERQWRPLAGRLWKGFTGPSMTGEHDYAIAALRLKPGAVALDVACGTGAFTRTFGKQVGPEGLAIGLDASRPMLGQALASTEIVEPVAYLRADAVHPPLRDEVADGVCCFAALHLFTDPVEAIDSFARVLKPGGRLALLTTARHTLQPFETVDKVGGLLAGVRIFDRDEVWRMLDDAGFVEVDVRYSGFAQFLSARLP